MVKTRESYSQLSEKLTINADTLLDVLDCGRATAMSIAKEAGAEVTIGRRKLYNVKKIQEYLDKTSC